MRGFDSGFNQHRIIILELSILITIGKISRENKELFVQLREIL